MTGSGAEVAVAGRLIGQVARSISTGTNAGPFSPNDRARTYGAFHRAAVDTLALSEQLVAQQRTLAPSWRPILAGLSAVLPSALFNDTAHPLGPVAAASAPTARLLLLHHLAAQFDQHRAIRAEVGTLRETTSQLLGALADVRLIGSQTPQRHAENVVMLLGEMLEAIPVASDQIVRYELSDSQRYERIRDAVGFHLREFAGLARLDLSRWPWRRREREDWWQVYRPKRLESQLPEFDVATLIDQSKA